MEEYIQSSPDQINQSLADSQIHENMFCCMSLKCCGWLLCINRKWIYLVFSFLCLCIHSPMIQFQNLPRGVDGCPRFHFLTTGRWLNFLFRPVTMSQVTSSPHSNNNQITIFKLSFVQLWVSFYSFYRFSDIDHKENMKNDSLQSWPSLSTTLQARKLHIPDSRHFLLLIQLSPSSCSP